MWDLPQERKADEIEKAMEILKVFDLDGHWTTKRLICSYGKQRKLEISRAGHRSQVAAAG